MPESDGTKAGPSEGNIRRRLRDGTPVRLFPIGPDDAAGLMEGFAQLSPESRQSRFLQPKAALSADEVAYLTDIDQIDHLAWGAVDLSTRPHPAAGVARCIRLQDEPGCAEVAVTIVDAYQGRGLGTLLVNVLAKAARRQGIRRFVAEAASDNAAALGLARHIGATRTGEGPSNLVSLSVDLVRLEPPESSS